MSDCTVCEKPVSPLRCVTLRLTVCGYAVERSMCAVCYQAVSDFTLGEHAAYPMLGELLDLAERQEVSRAPQSSRMKH